MIRGSCIELNMRVLDLIFLICKVSGLAWEALRSLLDIRILIHIRILIPDLTKQKTSDERPAC